MELLIVEDNDDINAMICQYLQKSGFACTQAYAGTEGFLCFQQGNFDLIILDLMLPGMDGLGSFRHG